MSIFTLYVGNKNYSSWSMRGWLVARLAGLDFKEVMMDLSDPATKDKIKSLSGAGCVPILAIDNIIVWDSLSISEYCAERTPEIWPLSHTTRARARSLTAEVHSSFAALRAEMPMNIRATDRQVTLSNEALQDIHRVNHVWTTAHDFYQSTFLFGDKPCVADCFYAPFVSRLTTYQKSYEGSVSLSEEALNYMETIKRWPLYVDWLADAQQETIVLEYAERG